jgi:hypothetical protein
VSRAALAVLVVLALGCRTGPRRRASAVAPPGFAPPGFAPQSAAFELPFGGEATEDFRLTGATQGAALIVVSGGDPDLRIEPLPGDHDVNAGLRIRASGRKVGVRVGTLLVATGLSAPRQVPLLFALRVRGTLRVSPTNPLVDLSNPSVRGTFIDVSSARADFVVTAVEIKAGPFTASFERSAAAATFRITVTASTEKMAKGARGAAGTLVVLSNDAAEPRKEIPLFAFGASDPPR